MHVVKQVVQQSSGSGRSFFIGSGRNWNPQKSKIRPELTAAGPELRCIPRNVIAFELINSFISICLYDPAVTMFRFQNSISL